MQAFGGMITVELDRDLAGTKTFLERTQLFTLAESLGGVESLIEHPALMTHGSIPAEKRGAIGISDSLVRLSAGIEDADDLIADLDQALAGEGECRGQFTFCRSRRAADRQAARERQKVNAPPPKGGGFRLRLKAGSVRLRRTLQTHLTSKLSSCSGGFWFLI